MHHITTGDALVHLAERLVREESIHALTYKKRVSPFMIGGALRHMVSMSRKDPNLRQLSVERCGADLRITMTHYLCRTLCIQHERQRGGPPFEELTEPLERSRGIFIGNIRCDQFWRAMSAGIGRPVVETAIDTTEQFISHFNRRFVFSGILDSRPLLVRYSKA